MTALVPTLTKSEESEHVWEDHTQRNSSSIPELGKHTAWISPLPPALQPEQLTHFFAILLSLVAEEKSPCGPPSVGGGSREERMRNQGCLEDNP